MLKLISHVCLNQREKFLMPSLGEESKWNWCLWYLLPPLMIHELTCSDSRVLMKRKPSIMSSPSQRQQSLQGMRKEDVDGYSLRWLSVPKNGNESVLGKRSRRMRENRRANVRQWRCIHVELLQRPIPCEAGLHTCLILPLLKLSKFTMGSVGCNVMYHHSWAHRCHLLHHWQHIQLRQSCWGPSATPLITSTRGYKPTCVQLTNTNTLGLFSLTAPFTSPG